MTHADDEGMVTPPRVAPYQVILLPVIKKPEDEEKVMAYIRDLALELKNQMPFSEKIRIRIDKRLKQSVDKFWEWRYDRSCSPQKDFIYGERLQRSQ